MDGAYRPVGRTRNPPSLELASSPQGHISIKRNCGTLRKKKKKKAVSLPRDKHLSPQEEKNSLDSHQGEPHVYASALPISRAVTGQLELWNPRKVASRNQKRPRMGSHRTWFEESEVPGQGGLSDREVQLLREPAPDMRGNRDRDLGLVQPRGRQSHLGEV